MGILGGLIGGVISNPGKVADTMKDWANKVQNAVTPSKPSGGGGGGASGSGSYTQQYSGGNAALDSALKGYSDRYNAARAQGDWQGMREASDSANQLRNQYGYAAEDASRDISYIAGQNGGYGGGGGGSYYPPGGGQQQGQSDLYAQLLEEQRRKEAEIKAQQEAAKKAAVEQAVGQLQGQKTGLEQSYADLYRQLYLDRRKAEKNLPQQMAAMGYNGGMTESTALGLQTSYADALRQGEQAKLGTMSDIDRAIQDARLNGDISIAEQAAQLAQQGFSSYADIIKAMQGQRNWNQEFGYQAGRDQVSDGQWQQSFDHNRDMDLQNLSRTQLLDQLSRDDVDYSRKLSAAQYLYERLGDASGLSILGYTPEQIAALGQSWAQQQAAKPYKSVDEEKKKEREPAKANAYFNDGARMSAGYSQVWQKVRTMYDRGGSAASIASAIQTALSGGQITQAEAEKMLNSLGMGA